MDKYFVLTDLGYGGLAIIAFASLEEANKAYEEDRSEARGLPKGVAMIKGTVVKTDHFPDLEE